MIRTAILIAALVSSACNVARTRPVQEIVNAEAALRAAKDLHADTLTPEIYRVANETFYKAKREYRMKNFDMARSFALKTIRLAEKAEFESYLKGGAAPEANSIVSNEGASGDPETALRKAHELRKKSEDKKDRETLEKMKEESVSREMKHLNEPTLDEAKTDKSKSEGSTQEKPKEEKAPEAPKPGAI